MTKIVLRDAAAVLSYEIKGSAPKFIMHNEKVWEKSTITIEDRICYYPIQVVKLSVVMK